MTQRYGTADSQERQANSSSGRNPHSNLLPDWVQQNLSPDAQQAYGSWTNATTAQGRTQDGMYIWRESGGRISYQPFPQPTVPSWNPNAGTQYNMTVGSRGPGPTTNLSYMSGGYDEVPLGVALESWMNLPPEGQALLQQATTVALGYDWTKGRNNLGPTWEFAVNQSRMLNERGIKRDPMEILQDIINGDTIFGVERTDSSSSGGGGGGGPSTTVVRTVNISTPDAARRLVNQAMTSYLGREATKDEIDSFTKLLNKNEESNPTIQTMTMTPSGSVMEQSQRVEGGFDAAQFTADYAQSRPDYAEYRAATDLMGAFMSIIDGPI